MNLLLNSDGNICLLINSILELFFMRIGNSLVSTPAKRQYTGFFGWYFLDIRLMARSLNVTIMCGNLYASFASALPTGIIIKDKLGLACTSSSGHKSGISRMKKDLVHFA